MSKCIGCGIKLQDNDKNKLGYTPNLNNKYCERCFKTIHYNEERKISNIDNYQIINEINKLSYFTIFITDLLSINNDIINYYKKINNDKILVINKCDIVPNNLNIDNIIDNIKNIYNINDEIVCISAKNGININRIINIIKDNKTVIFCGETSSGKSTLINNLIGSNLTTSKYSNTTLDFIKLKIEDYNIYDSPGINLNRNNNYEKVIVNTKQINDKYILSIDDLKIRCNGNLTFIVPIEHKINSKKDNGILNIRKEIKDNSDIVLDKGFIYIKSGTTIYTNKNLEIRKSIIK